MNSRRFQRVVSKQQPEAKYGFSEDIENSISNDLSIRAGLLGAVGNAPDTNDC